MNNRNDKEQQQLYLFLPIYMSSYNTRSVITSIYPSPISFVVAFTSLAARTVPLWFTNWPTTNLFWGLRLMESVHVSAATLNFSFESIVCPAASQSPGCLSLVGSVSRRGETGETWERLGRGFEKDSEREERDRGDLREKRGGDLKMAEKEMGDKIEWGEAWERLLEKGERLEEDWERQSRDEKDWGREGRRDRMGRGLTDRDREEQQETQWLGKD